MAAFCVSVYVRCQCHFRLPPTVHPRATLSPLLFSICLAAVDGCRFCCPALLLPFARLWPLTTLRVPVAHANMYVQTQICSRSRSRSLTRSWSRSQSASQLPQHGKRDSMFHVVFSWLWLWLWARYSFTKRYPFRCFAHINKHTPPPPSISLPLFLSLSHSLGPLLSHTHANGAHSSTS